MQSIQLSNLKTKWLGKTIYEFEEVTSTQDILRKEFNIKTPTGLVILTKRQTKGRGRQGRTWIDIPGDQIFSSILLRPHLPLEKLSILNIAAGLAICDALEELGIQNVALKWPNDVFVSGRKISGILSEFIQTSDDRAIIIGIGLNISGKSTEIQPELRRIATTVAQQIPDPDRLKIFTLLLNHLEEWINKLESKGTQPIQDEFKRRWIYSGLSISVEVGGNIVSGKATQIDDTGALLLKTNGLTQKIVSGDIISSQAK